MKERIAITLDAETKKSIEKLIDGKIFRSRSHFIEVAVSKLIEEKKNAK